MRKGEMGLHHHGRIVLESGIFLEALCLGRCLSGIAYSVSTINLFGDQFNSLAQRRIQIVEEPEVDRLLTGIDNGVREL